MVRRARRCKALPRDDGPVFGNVRQRRNRRGEGRLEMIRLLGPTSRLCDGLDRRELLRLGGLGLGGLGLRSLLERRAPGSETPRSFGKAKNCIILFLSGGAAHHDTFDPKPDAPTEIRGEFDTIATALPGLRFTKYLPRTARIMDRVALVRSM